MDDTQESAKGSKVPAEGGMTELLPCPFCGEVPTPESSVEGTQYEIWCGCGMACSTIQISDLMTLEERRGDPLDGYRYDQKYIDRARAEAIRRWNTRAR